ncbi:MAG: threonine--tRNA ligase [Bacillales bacterium]|nr:threonine--tRNA ligase [Bacillales bacterium]
MKIKLLDNYMEIDGPKKAIEIAEKISKSLAKKTIAVMVDGVLKDSSFVIEKDADVRFLTEEDKESLDILNHSTAHLMAEAIKTLYPEAKFGVGPTIEEGFYYDFDLGDKSIAEEDLKSIEKEMQKLSSLAETIERKEVSKAEALSIFKDDPYKTELINELPEGEVISIYTQGNYTDLCRGPHVPKTSYIKNFKLLSVAGAYWRGDSKNKQLQRIYGIAFFTKEALDSYLNLLEERKKRDHRKLGKELGLFMLSEYGPGFPFWLPKGMALRHELEEFYIKEMMKRGYKLIKTPQILNRELWETSGHWKNYKENMYTLKIDDKDYAVKPMNCPGGILVYKNDLHSYKDFPLKLAELGLVHRYEASGALSGLFRVRCFTQDDAHVFVRMDQVEDAVHEIIDLMDYIYTIFNLSYHIELSTRPLEKYIGEIATWDKAEEALANACKSAGKDYILNPGDGAFYGPKLDFKLRDSMNRIWQCGTIQLDMNLPERFDLTYVNENGDKVRPIMLHRAIFGSIERFIGILIEHYAGAFPLWLSPVQVSVIPVSEDFHMDYSKKVFDLLIDKDIRAELDSSSEKLGYKIRKSQVNKVPYQIVLGDKEKEDNTVTYRKYGETEQVTVSVDDFLSLLKKEIEEKK